MSNIIFSLFSSINVASGAKTGSYTGLYPSSPGSPTDAQLNSLPKDKKRARVLYNYKAFDSSELMLTADEVIFVLNKFNITKLVCHMFKHIIYLFISEQ